MQNELWLAAAPANAASTRSTSHVLDLAPGAEALWTGFKGRTRRDVRRSEREGVTVEMRSRTWRVGRLLQGCGSWPCAVGRSASTSRCGWRNCAPAGAIRCASSRRWRTTSVTGCRCSSGRSTVNRWWPACVLVGTNAQVIRGVMDADKAGPVLATDLVEWRAIEACCAAGCRRYHLGDSGENASLAAFKEKFGAAPVRFDELILERLPFSQADALARRAAKAMLRFKD